MPENVTTEVSIPSGKTANPMDFFPLIWDGDWKKLPLEQQLSFRTEFAKMVSAVGLLRGKFDETVWEGWDDGSVDPSVKSIRARRTGDPGGAPKKVKTADEILFGKD